MAPQDSCPVKLKTVNEYQPRIVATQVVLILVLYVFFSYWIIPALLTIDFLLRSGNRGSYSLLNNLAMRIVRDFQIKGKPVDIGPKRFAAKLGGCLSMVITFFDLFDYSVVSIYLSMLLIGFAFLESLLGYCVGCAIYQWKGKVWPRSSFTNKINI